VKSFFICLSEQIRKERLLRSLTCENDQLNFFVELTFSVVVDSEPHLVFFFTIIEFLIELLDAELGV